MDNVHPRTSLGVVRAKGAHEGEPSRERWALVGLEAAQVEEDTDLLVGVMPLREVRLECMQQLVREGVEGLPQAHPQAGATMGIRSDDGGSARHGDSGRRREV